MRKAICSDKGQCYVSFFQLSIGLERLMKTTLIVDHMVNNAMATPTEQALKGFRHHLDVLIEEVRKVDAGVTPHPLDSIQPGTLDYEILCFLSVFADRTRYHNLNKLSLAPSSQSFDDPLESWGKILHRILQADVKPKRVRTIAERWEAVAAMMEGIVLIAATDLDKSSLSHGQFLSVPALQAEAARYAVWHVSKITKAISDCLIHASFKACRIDNPSLPAIPDMLGLCLPFLPLDKRHTLNKRRWP